MDTNDTGEKRGIDNQGSLLIEAQEKRFTIPLVSIMDLGSSVDNQWACDYVDRQSDEAVFSYTRFLPPKLTNMA
jgi:hypothetical protein